MFELGVNDRRKLTDIRAYFLQHWAHNAAVFLQKGGQEMHRLDLRIASLRGQLLRAGHGLLGLDREFVETEGHVVAVSFQLSAISLPPHKRQPRCRLTTDS